VVLTFFIGMNSFAAEHGKMERGGEPMQKAGRVVLILLVIMLVLWQTGALSWFLARTIFQPDYPGDENGDNDVPDPSEDSFSVQDLTYRATVLAEGLNIPWDMAFLPDGRILVTERVGQVVMLPERTVVLDLPAALQLGEGGLLGIALDPDFADNAYVYLYYTYRSGSSVFNRVSRYTLTDDLLQNEEILLDALPGAAIHNGGRIRFGPDGMLYVAVGDAAGPERAQDPNDLAGKILRYRPDGSIPADNPSPDSPVYSMGHRNPQGLAWHPVTGVMYASEHGPTRQDEINRIIPGGNYGWPEVTCGEGHGDFLEPVACYVDFTLAPSGMDFLSLQDMAEVSLYVAGLRGNMIRRLDFDSDEALVREDTLFTDWGRIRLVMQHEGSLYVLTNNRDGRGNPRAGDDRLIWIEPLPPDPAGAS
jgi:aldose sugar dehydrogenase